MKKGLLKGTCTCMLALGATLAAVAPASAATRTTPSHVSPLDFSYVRGFYTAGDCYSYGYSHYSSTNQWFCVQSPNPDTLPWALWAEGGV